MARWIKNGTVPRRMFCAGLAALLWLGGGLKAGATLEYFRLDGERLWLEASQTPLLEILSHFSRTGVEVYAPPDTDVIVNASFRGEDVDQALPALLAANDYFLRWKMIRGPLGRIPKLSEIRVFSRNHPGGVQLLPSARQFDTTHGIAGSQPEFVRDELLLAVRPGTTYAAFTRLLDEIGGMLIEHSHGVYLIRFPVGTNVEDILSRLLSNPMIAHAELNYVNRLPSDLSGFDSAALRLGNAAAGRTADGSIPVAVLDSGLERNPGLDSVLVAAWDAMDPARDVSDPDGHGTYMAGLASGLLAADGLPAADALIPLVAIRAFDEEGRTSNFTILQALEYAIGAGAKVVNMSWGSTTESTFMNSVIQQALNNGLIIVAAAGNTPDGKAVYPAAYQGVLAVGGTQADGHIWSESNYGGFVDLSAPAIATTRLEDGRLSIYAGTSLSAAVVANALGQYYNQHPDAAKTDVLEQLFQSLSTGAPDGYGLGILDAAALERLLSSAP